MEYTDAPIQLLDPETEKAIRRALRNAKGRHVRKKTNRSKRGMTPHSKITLTEQIMNDPLILNA